MSVPGSRGEVAFMRTTFGVLVTRDAGLTWRWMCERTFGYQGQWDPPIAATRDGRLWVGLADGVASTLDGCNTTRAPEIEGETIKDLTVAADGETIFAIAGKPTKRAGVWKRAPGSGKWERLPSGGLEELNLLSIEVAGSKIYVTGEPYSTPRGRLYTSTDGGKTFKGEANDLKARGPFFIAAIDPADDTRVILRHLHDAGSDVLVTHDGKTFENVLSMKTAMFGFAKSDDGKTYWAGSGLPGDGVLRSDDRGAHFAKVASHGVMCLHYGRPGLLLVCENPLSRGALAIARSTDEGKTFDPVATFASIGGPIGCDAGAGALCDGPAWEEMQTFLAPRPEAVADAGIDGGGGSAGDAGSPAGPREKPRSSCSCRAAGAPDRGGLTAGCWPLFVWALARKRRGSRFAHPVRR